MNTMSFIHKTRIKTESIVSRLPVDELNEEIRIERKLIGEAISNGFPIEAKNHYANFVGLLLTKIKIFAEN